jgi:hypothetical protein
LNNIFESVKKGEKACPLRQRPHVFYFRRTQENNTEALLVKSQSRIGRKRGGVGGAGRKFEVERTVC